jgi:hypothetical protein
MRDLSKTIAAVALLALAAPAVATAQPAAAPPKAAAGGVNADVRCLLTMVAVGNSSKDHQHDAEIGLSFFAGRINARAPGADLTALVKATAPQMTPAQFQAELKRCGPMVANGTHSVQQALMALRPAGPPPPAAPAAPAPMGPPLPK